MVKSFGIVNVPTAGTPVRATVNAADPTARVGVQSFMVQAHPSNNNVIYVFYGGANFSGDHRTDGLALIGVIPAPASATQGPFAAVSFGMPNVPAGINLNDVWIDAGANDQDAIVSALV